jgi:replication factor C subunit 3/5
MSKDESMPHLIFYGPSGSGKKTIIRLFLEMLYDKSVHNLKDTEYTVTGSGNSTTHVIIKQSNYHIIIEPNNNNFDRYLIQDVVKEYARRVPLYVFTTKKIFKTVLINNIDNLSYYAQTSLRRTLEKYSGTCRFIMWSRSLTKVIDPLRSRCYSFRVNSPSEEELFNILVDVSSKENISLTAEDYSNILLRSNNNVKIALWLLELKNFGDGLETTYDQVIDLIIKELQSDNIKSILIIRDLLYKIMITNVTGTCIIKDIVDKLINTDEISEKSKICIIEKSAMFEHNLVRGRREIIHLEGLITNIMSILNKEKFSI